MALLECEVGKQYDLELISYPGNTGGVQILKLVDGDGDFIEVPVTELRGFGQSIFSLGNRYERCEDGVLRCIG